MFILERLVFTYLLVLVTETLIVNIIYPNFPLLPGDYPLYQLGLSARIPLLSSLIVALVLTLLVNNVPMF